jgi:hypothetical protein
MPVSSLLAAGPPAPGAPAAPPSVPPAQIRMAPEPPARNPALTLIAGVGVLLLAMGVGVLIGRSSSSHTTAVPPEVITVGSTGGAAPATAAEATFSADWPSGKNGYTVQLEKLPETGTSVSQVASAKSAASGKGATSVGALKSEEFSSLTSGSYIIYSGEYTTRAAAQKALGSLKKKFPSAKVIKVSNAAAKSTGESSKGGSKPAVESSLSKPAPESSLKHLKGKNAEEKSKELPEVVETG